MALAGRRGERPNPDGQVPLGALGNVNQHRRRARAIRASRVCYAVTDGVAVGRRMVVGQFAFKCRMGRARLFYGNGATAVGWAMRLLGCDAGYYCIGRGLLRMRTQLDVSDP